MQIKCCLDASGAYYISYMNDSLFFDGYAYLLFFCALTGAVVGCTGLILIVFVIFVFTKSVHYTRQINLFIYVIRINKNVGTCRYFHLKDPSLIRGCLKSYFFCGVLLIIMVKNIPMFYMAFFIF